MQPVWLTEQVFSEKIQPSLTQASSYGHRKRIGVSRWYAGRIREGYTHIRGTGKLWQTLSDFQWSFFLLEKFASKRHNGKTEQLLIDFLLSRRIKGDACVATHRLDCPCQSQRPAVRGGFG